jgi:rhodanese-related sulfurtransferase
MKNVQEGGGGMKSVFTVSFLLFTVLGTTQLYAGPSAYPDELVGKVQDLKTLVVQKREMPDSLTGISVVDTAGAERIWRSKSATFLDTRPRNAYESGRIPGAEWFFSDDLLKDPEAAKKLDKTREYVLYCNGVRCWRAAGVAITLRHLGFEKLVWYRDGYPGWKRQGLPTETVAKPAQ